VKVLGDPRIVRAIVKAGVLPWFLRWAIREAAVRRERNASLQEDLARAAGYLRSKS